MSRKKSGNLVSKKDVAQISGVHRARMALSPEMRSASTLKSYSKHFGEVEIPELVIGLCELNQKVSNGDLTSFEGVLASQVSVLDAIFNDLARRAMASDRLDQFSQYLKLSLRAQAQSRATMAELSAIKNPPIMGYVRQANIAHGPQQVNNVPMPPSERTDGQEKSKLKNELLEKTDGERLDTGTACAAGLDSPEMATLGEVNRTKDESR